MSVELALAAMNAVGIDSAIWAMAHGLSVAELAIKQHPTRFGAVLSLPSNMPDMAEQVRALKKRPGFLGIRITEPGWPPDGDGVARLRAGAWEPAFEVAELEGLPLQLFVAGHVEEAEQVLRAHPDLSVNLIHWGLFRAPPHHRFQGDKPFEQLPALLKLASFPNVVVGLTNGPSLSKEAYPWRDLWSPLLRIIEAFGPERVIWGSDYTRNRGVFTLGDWVSFLRFTDNVTEREKELMFAVNARRFYNWPRR